MPRIDTRVRKQPRCTPPEAGASDVGEQKLFYDDVSEGDVAPEFSHRLTRTDVVLYAGASGDFNPMLRSR
jgi:acyl dehydratase